MKKVDMFYILLSLMIALTGYISTNIIYVSIAIFVVYNLYYFVLIRKKIRRYYDRIERIHSCYHFINSFVITLSVKDSFEEAYTNGLRLENKNLEEEVSQIENMPIIDRLKYLRRYFNLGMYRMFTNVIGLYQDQGGNILTLSDGLLRECTRVEKSLSESVAIGRKHLVEFVILWFLSFLILVFLRFSLSQFYTQMISSMMIIGMICGFYVLCLASTHLFLSKFSKISIKEDVEE